MEIYGTITEPVDGSTFTWRAPAPAIRNGSYSGSGMPFASPSMAFENTPNQGKAKVHANGEFRFTLPSAPNSFHDIEQNGFLCPPIVILTYQSNGKPQKKIIEVPEVAIPYRLSAEYPTLRKTHQQNFYSNGFEPPARSQESILRASGYENPIPKNFWGSRPPL